MAATPSREIYLDVADAIGARLCRDALWSGTRCNWLGASMEPVSGEWMIAQRTFGPDLYSGTSGIALFLGHLYAQVHERIFRLTALGALRQALSRVEDITQSAWASFYSGVTGIAYVSSRLAKLLDDPALERQALDLLTKVLDTSADEQGLDVLSGYAGSIPALLYLGQAHDLSAAVDVAVTYGQRLLDAARQGRYGWSWNTMQAQGQPDPPQPWDLLGFSHGTAGIAWSLLELHRVTGQSAFREAAIQALRYERHWFSPQHQNWPDFRSFQENPAAAEPGFMIAWCHGAPGIGLSRLRAYQLLQDPLCRREAEIAVQTTGRAIEQTMLAGQGSFCLCHGLAGNAEFLLHAGTILEEDRYRALADRVGHYGVERYHVTGSPWPCGVMGGGETSGLFLGLAGIGHFFLRLYDPAAVPPVTILIPDGDR